jgi:predicted ferric reductase
VRLAQVGIGILVLTWLISLRAIRNRLPYALWHTLHLLTYAAIVLGFIHATVLGTEFGRSRWSVMYWSILFALALGSVALWRLLTPLWRNAKHRLVVARVVPESDRVVSVYVTGRNLDQLGTRAGQFFLWRFLARGCWFEAHPYSVSAAPTGQQLRITVKEVGKGSRSLRHLLPGTRVFVEGPYGAFTMERRTRSQILLVGGGIGITPIRALLEELAADGADTVVVYRTSTRDGAVLLNELTVLAAGSGAEVHLVTGTRQGVGAKPTLLGPEHLAAIVPDASDRDVYICGPHGLTAHLVASLRALGVPAERCHVERFAFAD